MNEAKTKSWFVVLSCLHFPLELEAVLSSSLVHQAITMSSRRPGTVDYSKWDNFECSDSEAEEEEEHHHYHNFDGATNSDDEEEEEDSYDDGEEEDDEDDDDDDDDDSEESRILDVPSQRRRTVPSNSISRSAPKIPPPSLLSLQRAWNTDISNISRPCSNCFAPNAQYRCSRCQLVRYCNLSCQRSYHVSSVTFAQFVSCIIVC